MDERKFRRAILNPRNIPGVYNYCDRWCERCPLTLRCGNYATGVLMDKDQPPHERAMESLWPRLAQCEPLAAALLKQHADHPGVGLPEKPRFKGMRRDIGKNRSGAAATRYMEFAHQFVEKHQSRFKHPAPPPSAHTEPQSGTDDAATNLPPVTADEAFDVINWHHLFIPVKLHRALHRDAFDEEMASDPETADTPSGHDGSAKIALISMDRSIIAWAVLAAHLPEFADASLNAMLTLDRLRRAVEKEMPKARAFVRPGFDTLRFK